MQRKIADCRDHPNDQQCTLTIAGEEREVIRAAADHAVSVHGEKDSDELREMIARSLKDEPAEWGLSRQRSASPTKSMSA